MIALTFVAGSETGVFELKNPWAVNLVVIAGHGDRGSRMFDISRGEFYGTAFAITGEHFLTAWHVWDAASHNGDVALGRLGPPQPLIQLVDDVDAYPDIDLALLHCRGLDAETLPVTFDALPWFADVAAMGFPFGMEIARTRGESHIYQLRAFKGHIVNRCGLTILNARPPGYELSFIPPPGLSGAPLIFAKAPGSVEVKGIVLKHQTTELGDGRRMELGLALDLEELLTLESRILGGSVAEKIFNRKKLIRS